MADKQKTFFLGVVIDMLGMPLNIFLGFFVVPLYLLYITTEEYGYWSTLLEGANAFSYLVSSFDLWLVRQISGRGENESKGKTILIEGAVILSALWLLTLVLAAISTLVYPEFWMEHLEREPLLVWSMGLWLLILSLSHFFASILVGLNRMPLINSLLILNKFGYMVLPLVFLALGWQLASFGLGYGLMIALMLLIHFSLCRKQVQSWLKLSLTTGPKVWEPLRFATQNFISKLGLQFYNFANIFIIASFLSTIHVAIYVLSLKLTNFLRFVVPRIITVGYPSFARLIAEDNYSRMREVLLKLFRFSFRLGLLFGGVVWFLNEPFVTHWIGAEHLAVGWFSAIAAMICLKEAIFPIFYQAYFASPLVEKTERIFILEWAIHLGLALYWVGDYGITGVLAAALISTGTISLIFFMVQTCRMIELPLSALLGSSLSVTIKSLPNLVVLGAAAVVLRDGFSWLAFLAWLMAAGLVNLISFEGRHLWEMRGLAPKAMIKDLIERS